MQQRAIPIFDQGLTANLWLPCTSSYIVATSPSPRVPTSSIAFLAGSGGIVKDVLNYALPVFYIAVLVLKKKLEAAMRILVGRFPDVFDRHR
jgi:hypothetical protein